MPCAVLVAWPSVKVSQYRKLRNQWRRFFASTSFHIVQHIVVHHHFRYLVALLRRDSTWYCGCLRQHLKISTEVIKPCELRITPPSHTCCLNMTFCSAEGVCKWMFRESSSGHACLWAREKSWNYTCIHLRRCVCYLKQICKLLSSRIGTYWKESLSVFTNVCLAEASCTIQCFFVLFIFDASQADFAL